MTLSVLRSPRTLRASNPLSFEERGNLLDPEQVAAQCFNGHVKRKWVLRNAPAHIKHKVGRDVLFYEGEVRQWIESMRAPN